MSTYERALEIATVAHKGQKRWNGDSYISHPIRLANQFASPDMKIIALQHDLLEDTNVGACDLRAAGFSEYIIETIDILTHNKETQTYLEYILRVKSDPIASQIKLADLADNMSDLRKGSMLDKYQMAKWVLEHKC